MGTATMSKPTAVSLLLWDRPADMRMYRSTAAAAACECGQCHVVSVRRPQNTDLFDVHKACLSTFCSISLFYRLVQLAFSVLMAKCKNVIPAIPVDFVLVTNVFTLIINSTFDSDQPSLEN